jgi:hypothetical protein
MQTMTTKTKAKRKPKAKPKHPGGRPVTTGSRSVPIVSFRAPSAEAWERLQAAAEAAGISPSQLAKARTFPGSPGST